ncbi:Fanconi anemia group M protein [Embiotoca jacksoni]|uniref:Fanconi anemia group M protein n=1 Tax=Embiotoca jacksoni TaxID=100190 RepID=UPI003703D4B8
MSCGSNQRTLLQTWGAPAPQNKGAQPKKDGKKAAGRSRPAQVATTSHPPRNPLWTEFGRGSTNALENTAGTEDPIPVYDDEDDDLMVVAVYEAERSLQLDNANFFQDDNPVRSENTTQSPTTSRGKAYPDFPGFDSSSAEVWIYPTNYPLREYQLKISEAALFQNTLVCLPTGLGKTFIAAVVMYNFYRWYPSGKIVFMAPTKPLVAQQIEACYKVMGIPQAHMAELTGSTAANQRQGVWRSKRVFFLTPQVMVNDLSRDTCPAQQVKCVVIDEAHKALGNHAYCQVIRQLGSQTLQFRVLALSATPGGDTKSVQAVISNLLISHIELRSEESPDIQAHSHRRSLEKVVVPPGEALSAQQARYLQVLQKFMSRLVQNQVMAQKDLRTLTKYQIIIARDQFRKNPPPYLKGPQQGMLEGDFALCISLYHGYELLMQMGLRSLFFYVQGIMDGSRGMSRAKNELLRTPAFMDLYHDMEAMFVKPSAGPDEPFIYSHPKLKKLEEVVLQHFRLWAERSADNNGSGHQEVSTRVMIFSSFRESVQEIAAMLNCHASLIRVMTFMGQSSAGKGVKGFTQKEQLEVVQRFRQGGFNTLVSTCVGEEGLDIGEVDLIVCFDAQKNPIRLVQRMGRTGRKRQGRIVVILAEGREERTYNQSQSNKRSVYKSIIGNKIGFHMFPNSPRMLPEEVKPSLHKMHITCGQFDPRESSSRPVGGRRSRSVGRASLIHPQTLIHQGSATSAGFLSSTEHSLWASTMRLEEHEAHPTLKQSHFMSIPSDPAPQEDVSEGRPASRELSLWEWRHWQHKALPFHVVDHSLRCNHFIKVMELIDGMREENEGECRYEQELLPYLQEADGVKGRQKKRKASKVGTASAKNKPKPPRPSRPESEWVDEELPRESASTLATTKHELPADDREATHDDIEEAVCFLAGNSGCPVADIRNDCAVVDGDVARVGDDISQLIAENDKDVELQAMFYFPKSDSAPSSRSDKLLPVRNEKLKAILANVAGLLSRSPPSLTDVTELDVAASSHPPSPQPPPQPFVVSFSLGLDVDDDDDDEEVVMMMMGDADNVRPESHQTPVGKEGSKISPDRPHQEKQPVRAAADSPTWEEVFGDEEVDNKETDDEMRNDFEEERARAETGENKKTKSKNGGTREEDGSGEDAGFEERPRLKAGGSKEDMSSPCGSRMDESIDLFGDDEAFLQMTIPDIPAPEGGVTPGTSPGAKDFANSTEKVSKRVHAHTPTTPRRMTQSADGTHRLNTVHVHARAQTKAATDASTTDKAVPPHRKSPAVQEDAESRDISRDLFPVNFDLCYSLEDSEDEADVEFAPAPRIPPSPPSPPPPPDNEAASTGSSPAAANSSTPYGSSTPHTLSEHRTPERDTLSSPNASTGARRALMPGLARPACPSLKRRRAGGGVTGPVRAVESIPHSVEIISDSEDEVVLRKRRHRSKVNPLSSPELSKISSDVDSPVVARRKRAAALNTSDEADGEAVSDDDFQNESTFTCRTKAAERQRVQQAGAKHAACRAGHQFLDAEAELSEEAEVSSDEEDGEAQNRSLEGFVVDNAHFSQGLNDSEMQGVYLKSVRSPAVRGKFKMSHKKHRDMDIFSQVPEMDETYAEDSFVVGTDEEEEEEGSDREAEDVELMPEASYVDGRRQYATRRRVFLHQARARAESPPEQRAGGQTKRTRVIRINDSSEEEEEKEVSKEASLNTGGDAVPLWPKAVQPEPSLQQQQQQQQAASSASAAIASKVLLLSKAQGSSVGEEQRKERCHQKLKKQHLLSDELDFVEAESSKIQPQARDSSAGESPASSRCVCILADSRCLSGGGELMTCLRRRHAATVHVCSLDGGYFIVSNRMAVERLGQSDLAAAQGRRRLADRVNGLRGLFERVCLLVEKDRAKTGEASRPFQRTRHYDGTLAALARTGVRLLWSAGAEESAGLLAELARLELRKGRGIAVPPEVRGRHRQQALQLYRMLPSVSYIHALNMSHNFSSIAQLINSPVEAIQEGGCMSPSRAEEVYRFLRYSCDSFLMNTSKPGESSRRMSTLQES